MTNQNNHSISSRLARLMQGSRLFNLDAGRAITSLKAFSKVFFVFSLMFLGAFCFKLFTIDPATAKNFRLIISDIDILPIYKADFTGFIFMSVYEIIRMLLIALIFLYFIRFLNSVDIKDPFKNIKSKDAINLVALLTIMFFVVDAVGAMHLGYLRELLPADNNVRIFHFEYLFLTYFIHVFAVIFGRGVDLNNEIDLVI